MSYKIEEKGTMRIVGVRTPLVEDMEINLETVPGFWAETVEQKDFSIVCSLVNSTSESVLGVSVYENPFNIYYYIAAFTDIEVYPIQNGKKRKGHSQVWISIKKKESEKDVSFKTKRKSLPDGDKTGNNF